MTDNIPANAISISFQYGEQHGRFHVWATRTGHYQWSALANSGEEETLDKAIAAARDWIRFDINSNKENQ